MKHPVKPEHMPPHTAGGDMRPPRAMDPEEARIFQQSLPAEEVTRDFLQKLLEEHRASIDIITPR